MILGGEFAGARVAYLGTDRDLGVVMEIFSGAPGVGALQLLELCFTRPLAKRPRLAACERACLHGESPGRA